MAQAKLARGATVDFGATGHASFAFRVDPASTLFAGGDVSVQYSNGTSGTWTCPAPTNPPVVETVIPPQGVLIRSVTNTGQQPLLYTL